MSDSRPPILDAIWNLLTARQPASVAAIRRYARLPEPVVVQTLGRNRELVGWDRRGRVISLRPLLSKPDEWMRAEVESGRAYRVDDVDYGHLVFRFGGPLYDAMKTTYWGGGIGDSCRYEVVEATPENEARLRAAGLVRWDELEAPPLTRWWQEDPNDAG